MEETKQLYSNGEPFCPTTNYENDNAAEKIEVLGKRTEKIQKIIDEIVDRVTNRLLERAEIAEWAKQEEKPSYTAEEVGADGEGSAQIALAAAKEYADGTYRQATGYTNQKIAELVSGAEDTLDTLGEIEEALRNNKTVVDALHNAIGNKANDVELQAHMSNETVHITASERTAWNAAKTKLEGIADGADAVAFTQVLKSGTKVGTITISGVNYDLYAPVNTDTTYGPATASSDGLMTAVDKVKLNGIDNKQDKATAINTSNIGSQSVKYASNSGNADTVDHKHFHWNGQPGYPSWYWGGNEPGTDMYVYNPLNLPFVRANGKGEVAGSLSLASGVGILFKSDARIYSDATQKLIIAATSESDYQIGIGIIESAWAFCPWHSDGYVRLGSPSRKWAQIYSTVASISTSDRREKTDIKDINYDDIKNFLRELRPVYYHLTKRPEKEYAGLIAQEVEQAMIKHNIPEDFGLLDKYPAYDDKGNETGDYIYGLCYEQLITLLLVVVQNELLTKK